jgi:hypothetical protein
MKGTLAMNAKERKLLGILHQHAGRILTRSETHDSLSVVEQHSGGKLLPCRFLKFPEAVEIVDRDSRRSLHVDARQSTGTLENNVDLHLVLVTEMAKGDIIFVTACLSSQLLQCEGFQQMAEQKYRLIANVSSSECKLFIV